MDRITRGNVISNTNRRLSGTACFLYEARTYWTECALESFFANSILGQEKKTENTGN